MNCWKGFELTAPNSETSYICLHCNIEPSYIIFIQASFGQNQFFFLIFLMSGIRWSSNASQHPVEAISVRPEISILAFLNFLLNGSAKQKKWRAWAAVYPEKYLIAAKLYLTNTEIYADNVHQHFAIQYGMLRHSYLRVGEDISLLHFNGILLWLPINTIQVFWIK